MSKDKTPFSDLFDTIEKQRKEMEKVMKPFLDQIKKTKDVAGPILEFQKTFLEKSMELQKSLMHHAIETTGKIFEHVGEEQKKQSKESERIMEGAGVPSQVKDYVKSVQKLQENWLEQLQATTKMMEDFLKSSETKRK
ncbi:MAG TPA: hypothetical protein VGA95_05515 [Thermodesulfobacteriota bacterium]|jgi:hypothetical protein